MTREEFKKSLTKDGILWRENKGKIIVTSDAENRGSVFMVDYEFIPVDLEFENRGDVHFSDCDIPEGTLFRNSGNVYISREGDLKGVIFENGKNVSIYGVYHILPGTRFSNGEGVLFDGDLKSISPGVVFDQKWAIHFSYGYKGLKIYDYDLKIKEIDYKKIINLMIEEGVFDRG